jgi:cytochrome c
MRYLVLATAFALSACGSPANDETPAASDNSAEAAPTTTAATETAPPSFGQCAVCHKVEKDGGNGVGPNLHGVIGKKSAQVAGFNYSPAMKASGVTWDEASLDKYITNPRTFMPGNKMSFAGQADAAKRAEIIAWLKKSG